VPHGGRPRRQGVSLEPFPLPESALFSQRAATSQFAAAMSQTADRRADGARAFPAVAFSSREPDPPRSKML
jgi:hypothetical protein